MIQKLSKFLAKIFKEKLIRLEISIVKILVLYYSKTYYTEWFYNIVKFFFQNILRISGMDSCLNSVV